MPNKVAIAIGGGCFYLLLAKGNGKAAIVAKAIAASRYLITDRPRYRLDDNRWDDAKNRLSLIA
jgi:hypothetical protein